MKNLKFIAVLLSLIAISFVACKNNTASNNDSQEQPQRKEPPSDDRNGPPRGDRKGPPPGDRKGPPPGDRKGPPPGGSPVQTKTLEEIGGYKLGEVATDFSLKSVDGSMVSLAGFKKAKGYVVVFTCNECPFAKMYEDRLIALHNNYASKGYPIIAINANDSSTNEKESFEAMQKRAKEKEFPFPYVVDEGQKILPLYGAVRTPHVFVLDQEKKVQYIGAIDDNSRSAEDVKITYVEDAINSLEHGESPEINYTKAIGCPIKH